MALLRPIVDVGPDDTASEKERGRASRPTPRIAFAKLITDEVIDACPLLPEERRGSRKLTASCPLIENIAALLFRVGCSSSPISKVARTPLPLFFWEGALSDGSSIGVGSARIGSLSESMLLASRGAQQGR